LKHYLGIEHISQGNVDYEHEQTAVAEDLDPGESDAMTQYQERCRVKLPLIIQSKLEEMIAKELIPMEERLKTLVLEVVRTAQEELFEGSKEAVPFTVPDHPSHFITGRGVCLDSRPCNQAPRDQRSISSHCRNRLLSMDSGYSSNHTIQGFQQPNVTMALNSRMGSYLDPGWRSSFEDSTTHTHTQAPDVTSQRLPFNACSMLMSAPQDIIALPAYDIAAPVHEPTPFAYNLDETNFVDNAPAFFDFPPFNTQP
jgi:hypothetical protein